MTGICGLLLDRGIAVDERGQGGATPLQLAVLARRQETAAYLIRHGAKLDLKNDAGVSALDIVVKSGDTKFANDLKLAAAIRGG
jgi:ankyrin repeat protein